MQTAPVVEFKFDNTMLAFSQNWIWRAVYCLIDMPTFDPSPRWIASKLDISIEKAFDALEGLQSIGMIERAGTSYVHKRRSEGFLQVNGQHVSTKELFEIHVKVAPQILSKLSETDAFHSTFFQGNKELVQEYGQRFLDLYEEIAEEAKRRNINEIMASEISFVQVTKNPGGK